MSAVNMILPHGKVGCSDPVALDYLPWPRKWWKSSVPRLSRNLLIDVVHHFEEVGGIHAAGNDNSEVLWAVKLLVVFDDLLVGGAFA